MDYRIRIANFIKRAAQPQDKFAHQPRVYALARRIGEGLAYDDDVLFAAAWLHDIGVFAGHRPEDPEALACWDNVAYAVRTVPSLLAEFGFPRHKVHSVVDAISTHLPLSTPATSEGMLLRDADILEQLGAISVLRVVSKVGRHSRYPTHAHAVETLRKCLETLPSQLRFPAARHLAEARIQVLRSFVDAVEAEREGIEL